jgi:hypothetical protein
LFPLHRQLVYSILERFSLLVIWLHELDLRWVDALLLSDRLSQDSLMSLILLPLRLNIKKLFLSRRDEERLAFILFDELLFVSLPDLAFSLLL